MVKASYNERLLSVTFQTSFFRVTLIFLVTKINLSDFLFANMGYFMLRNNNDFLPVKVEVILQFVDLLFRSMPM